MDLGNIILSKISQSEKGKYHMISSCVESNEQTELTRKMGTDSWMESRWQLRGRGDEEVEGLSEKLKGLMDVDTSVVAVGVGGGYKGTKWQWKKYSKDYIKETTYWVNVCNK